MTIEELQAKVADLEGKLSQSTNQIGDLRKQLGQYDGIDPAQWGELKTKAAQADQLSTERDNLAKQNQELAAQKGQASLQLEAVQAATKAGVMPEYMPVMLPQITSALQFAEDGSIKAPEGKTPEQFAASLRDRFPAVFTPAANPVGTGQNDNGQQKSVQSRVVTPNSNGIITGVDPNDVLEGKAAIAASS